MKLCVMTVLITAAICAAFGAPWAYAVSSVDGLAWSWTSAIFALLLTAGLWTVVRVNRLHKLEDVYHTVIMNNPDGVLILDDQQRIVVINAAFAALTGCDASRLVGTHAAESLPQAVRWLADLAAQPSGTLEVSESGRRFEVRRLPLTVRRAAGGQALLLRDVTERKQNQAQLRQRADELAQLYEQASQLEQYKTEIIRMAAHDLRQPISIAMGYAEMLLRREAGLAQEQAECVESILKAARHANQILKDILSLERIEQQMTQDTAETFNFHALLGDVIAQHEDQALARGHTLHLEIDPDRQRYEVVGYAAQVAEAAANLIENAIKYTPDGGTLTIHLRSDDAYLIYEVEDTGCGIPEEMQGLLFRPFSRVRSSEVAHIEGTGLGLCIVKSVVERHNGSVWFRSVQGQGSTFGFRLPLRSTSRCIPSAAAQASSYLQQAVD